MTPGVPANSACVCVCVSAQEATGGERIQCQLLGRLSVYGQLPEGSTLYSYILYIYIHICKIYIYISH